MVVRVIVMGYYYSDVMDVILIKGIYEIVNFDFIFNIVKNKII